MEWWSRVVSTSCWWRQPAEASTPSLETRGSNPVSAPVEAPWVSKLDLSRLRSACLVLLSGGLPLVAQEADSIPRWAQFGGPTLLGTRLYVRDGKRIRGFDLSSGTAETKP